MSIKHEEVNNVIQLPTSITMKQLYDAEQSIKHAKEVKQEMCDEVLDFTIEQTLNVISSFGFLNDRTRVHDKDIVLLEQAVCSILYRYCNISHPLHDVIDDLIQLPGEVDPDDVDDSHISDEENEVFDVGDETGI